MQVFFGSGWMCRMDTKETDVTLSVFLQGLKCTVPLVAGVGVSTGVGCLGNAPPELAVAVFP